MFRPAYQALAFLALSLFACDSGDAPEPIVPQGELAEAIINEGQWTFIDVEGATCRDGSATGFGVRLQEGADNLMIYFQGGGACFNSPTCATNKSSYTQADFEALIARRADAGIFSTDSDNPVGDWNMVYVPYCTGDVHSGSAPASVVPGVDADQDGSDDVQQFVGHLNLKRYLDILTDELRTPPKVLVTGASAGGFGALFSFSTVADAFSGSDPYLFDDSGPIFFDDGVLSPELSATFSSLYNFPATLPNDADLFQTDGLQNIYEYYALRYPNATFGLASYLDDPTIRSYFGFGQSDGSITAEEYANGLRDLRAQLPSSWATYFASGEGHTLTKNAESYFGTSAGVALDDWLAGLLNGAPTHVDPGVVKRPLLAR